jgi:hypothetical protein
MIKIKQMLLLSASMIFAASSFAKDCSDVEFNSELRDKFPQIDEACLDILDHEGNQYIKLSGKIVSANTRSIALRWKRADGSYIDNVFRTKTLDPSFRIKIEGRKVRPSSLRRGQEINTYIMLGGDIATLMSDEPLAVAVQSAAMDDVATIDFDEAPAAMPTTASILPMLGLLGMFSLAMGGFVRVYRKRVA